MPDRSPEERERDRLEREARRAKKEGRAAPAPPPAAVPEPAPEATASTFDVQETSNVEDVAPPAAPPATNREWRRAAGDPDPDPPLVRRVEGREPREEVQAHQAPMPAPEPTPAPERRIPPPPPIDGEQALGTKRVSAGSRGHRPHLPQRRPKTVAAGPPSSGRKLGRRAGALLALAAVAFVLWFAASLFQPFAGDGGATVVVTIPKGATVSQVGDLLAEKNVVGSSFFFKLRSKLEGKDDELNSGRIALKRDMSYAAALDALTQPAKAAPKTTVKLTLPEGRSREEVAKTVKDAGISGDYLAATKSSKVLDPRRYGAPKSATLEGFLFPATYDLKASDDVKDLVAQQLVAFMRNFDTVDLKRAKRKNLTAYDIIVIASMIEREAGIAKDRPLISAVIYNRLKDGMPLGIDATLRYELKNWTDPLKVSELEADTPYNTRKRTGLPPGPIGSPGLSSIEAAAHPANVDYLFYVVRPCGNGAHNFSSTDAQFEQDVAAYNAKREELNGKSPVTCK